MVRELPAWHENISKRQVKSPKIYFRDSGILHALLGVHHPDTLYSHIKCGASFEGFAIEQVIRYEKAEAHECYFWSSHQQAELDLLILKNGKKIGYEFKFSENPTQTKSMLNVIQDLGLERLTLVYPGEHAYPLSEQIEVKPLSQFSQKREGVFSSI
jgi:hypothetical protein